MFVAAVYIKSWHLHFEIRNAPSPPPHHHWERRRTCKGVTGRMRKGRSPFQSETHKSHVRTHSLRYPWVSHTLCRKMEMPTTGMVMLVFFFSVSTEYMELLLGASNLAVATKYIQLQIHFLSGRQFIKRSKRMRGSARVNADVDFFFSSSVCSHYCWAVPSSRWGERKKKEKKYMAP